MDVNDRIITIITISNRNWSNKQSKPLHLNTNITEPDKHFFAKHY